MSATLAACSRATVRAAAFPVVPEASGAPSDTSPAVILPVQSGPVLYVLDGRVISSAGKDVPSEIASLDPTRIASVEVFKGKEARDRFGPRGENGVVVIVTRKQGDARGS
jgi:hypothetical protein